jgi:hypothetical protein
LTEEASKSKEDADKFKAEIDKLKKELKEAQDNLLHKEIEPEKTLSFDEMIKQEFIGGGK